MTRLAMGGLVHEIVTFLPEETTLEAFEERAIRGAAIIEAYQGNNTVYSGFLNTCQENGVTIEGLLCTEFAPSGPVARQVFEALALIADGVRPYSAVGACGPQQRFRTFVARHAETQRGPGRGALSA